MHSPYDLDGRLFGWKKPSWLTWRNAGKVATVATFAGCIVMSAGACAIAGLATAAIVARSKAKGFSDPKFKREFIKGAVWVGVGAGVGHVVGEAYKLRPTVAKFGPRIVHSVGKHAKSTHYGMNAGTGFATSIWSEGLYKGKRRK